jgi:hypothetical protein
VTVTQRRLAVTGLIVAGALAASAAYYLSLVPATHPDHDHGILNIDAGGRLLVTQRNGKTRNLVGAPGHVLLLHFFSTKAPGAAEEMASLLAFQRGNPAAKDAELLLIAHDPDFATLDAWLQANKLEPSNPDSFVLDPDGETTRKLNSKRPLETMFFGADGKLSSQSRGVTDWGGGAAEAKIAQARAGTTIE